MSSFEDSSFEDKVKAKSIAQGYDLDKLSHCANLVAIEHQLAQHMMESVMEVFSQKGFRYALKGVELSGMEPPLLGLVAIKRHDSDPMTPEELEFFDHFSAGLLAGSVATMSMVEGGGGPHGDPSGESHGELPVQGLKFPPKLKPKF